jgi:hypothetical protein
LGIEPDLLALDASGEWAGSIAWAHRRLENSDIYFVSNQLGQARDLVLSFRSTGRWPDLYDPLSGEIVAAGSWQESDGRTSLPLKIHPHGSLFVVFERNTGQTGVNTQANLPEPDHHADMEGPWEIRFDPGAGGPDSVLRLKELKSWHLSEDPRIRHYSGTAVYSHTFNWSGRETDAERFWLGIEELHNLAEVYLNGTLCGIIWTHPCRVEISDHLVNGENQLEIRVSNTWANRMIGDRDLPGDQRFSWTTLPFDMRDRSLLRAGICGKVSIYKR